MAPEMTWALISGGFALIALFYCFWGWGAVPCAPHLFLLCPR